MTPKFQTDRRLYSSLLHRVSLQFAGDRSKGMTFAELMTVIVIAGLLAAIAAPSFFGFRERQTLNVTQNQVLDLMRNGQAEAKRRRRNQMVSFKEENGQIFAGVHDPDAIPGAIPWRSLNQSVEIDAENTTMPLKNGMYSVEFDDLGNNVPPFRRLTLQSRSGVPGKRCVIVSTLIGAMRTAEDKDCER